MTTSTSLSFEGQPGRFAKGMTFEEYVKYTGSAENLAQEGFGGVYHPDVGSPRALREGAAP